MAAGGGEFVEGWLVAQVLGEGAYGEVRLLVHARSGAAVALKVVHADGEREARLHGALRHPHVVRCLGARRHAPHHYLFLEYCGGGELFERIEPDAGLGEAAARGYWRQLLAGAGYLHARGVAHRDLKPENLLLDHHDTLKISDFGMATLFRHGARERLLARVCGTAPYCAPEVLSAAAQPYRAPPADLWAAALVLGAMLAGELPWQRAHAEDESYARWQRWCSTPGDSPPPDGLWRKLSPPALALLRRALAPLASRRASLEELLQHPWSVEPLAQLAEHEPGEQPSLARGGSQPAPRAACPDLSPAAMDALVSSSQPAAADELLLGAASTVPLRRRLTRLWLRGSPERALEALAGELERRHMSTRRAAAPVHALRAQDAGGLVLRAACVRCGPRVSLLELRRARGCGLAFKRRFVELRAALAHLEVPPPHAHAHALFL